MDVGGVLSDDLTATTTGTGISYDAASGAINLTEPGVYLVAWNTDLAFDSDITGTIRVSLESSDGSIVYSTASAETTPAAPDQTVSGSAIIISDGSDSLILVNTSDNNVRYATPVTGSTNAEIRVIRIG